MAAQTLPETFEWEVLVVDNNSTDETRQVVHDFGLKHRGRFRYLFEPRQGLSHARNTGIREAQGDVLVFTDDDVTVAPNWLQNLTAPLLNGERAGPGGCTWPEPTFVPPQWLSLEWEGVLGPLAIFDGGPMHVISLNLLSAPIWLIERRCSKSTVTFESIWAAVAKTSIAMRTPRRTAGRARE